MNPFRELAASFSGWSEIVAGKPEAERHFVLDRRGLVVAIVFFYLLGLILLSVPSSFHDGTVWKPDLLAEE